MANKKTAEPKAEEPKAEPKHDPFKPAEDRSIDARMADLLKDHKRMGVR